MHVSRDPIADALKAAVEAEISRLVAAGEPLDDIEARALANVRDALRRPRYEGMDPGDRDGAFRND